MYDFLENGAMISLFVNLAFDVPISSFNSVLFFNTDFFKIQSNIPITRI